MSRRLALSLSSLLALLPVFGVRADDARIHVGMWEKSAATFYVASSLPDVGGVDLMVDTGSGYTTINERTLAVLKSAGRVRYRRQLRGILADGTELEVPLYAIERMRIGEACWLTDVEVAVFPGDSRQILGLSALRKLAPFVFSVDPPGLLLSGCKGQDGGDGQVLAPVVTTAIN